MTHGKRREEVLRQLLNADKLPDGVLQGKEFVDRLAGQLGAWGLCWVEAFAVNVLDLPKEVLRETYVILIDQPLQLQGSGPSPLPGDVWQTNDGTYDTRRSTNTLVT